MRILFASIHNYLDPSSGAAISMRTTLQTLADSGAKVRVFCGDRFDFDRYDDATLPSPIKLGCNDCRVKKCSTTINSDHAVYHRVSPDIGFMPVGSLSGFIYDGSSGSSSDFYIIPINNSTVQTQNKTVTLKLNSVVPYASGGDDNYIFWSNCDSATATLVDDDVEFVSVVDYDSAGQLPSLSSVTGATFPKNSDRYAAYIFYDPENVNVNSEQLDHIAPVSAFSLNDSLLGDIHYSIASGNDLGYFSIDSQSGCITLTDAYRAHASTFTNATLQIRATLGNDDLEYDSATVNIERKAFSVTPYTPTTVNISPMPIPKDKWSVNNVGIRRNYDYDAGLFQPDSFVNDRAIYGEDDLVRVYLNFTAGEGLAYKISRTDSNLKFWKSDDKAAGAYSFNTQQTCTLISGGNIWAEYTGTGDDLYNLKLSVVNAKTNVAIREETITFRPFNSVTCAFVGEMETPGDPVGSPGVNNWVVEQLLNGYDVHVWDDGYDITGPGSDPDCYPWGSSNQGEGHAFDEVVNAINNRGVSEVALIGYSHGGGSVYNLAWRMYWDGRDPGLGYSPREDRIHQSYSLVFTSYIDAVKNDFSTEPLAEDRKPLGTRFHTNQYQHTHSIPFFNDNLHFYYGLHGCSVDGAEDNLDRTYLNVVHSQLETWTDAVEPIDENEIVLDFLTMRFCQKTSR